MRSDTCSVIERLGCSAMKAGKCGAMCLRPKAVGAVTMSRPAAFLAPTVSASSAARMSSSTRWQSS